MFDPFKFYKGFYIKEAAGNNAFSYTKRSVKNIYIPPLIKGTLNDLSVGSKVAFCEIENGVEYNYAGLNKFIHFRKNNRQFFIFDNHNHAFFFWAYGLYHNLIKLQSVLVHVDQHSDMRAPNIYLNSKKLKNAADVFFYTNYVLDVGSFIKPALKSGIFNKVEIIDGNDGLKNSFSHEIVLDIDMDFFAKEMDFVPMDLKIEKIREYINQAKFVTIATSPFFINQQRAIELIPLLLS